MARCNVVALAGNVAPRTPSSDAQGDYLVVKDEAQVHLRSLLLFPAGHATSRALSPRAASANSPEVARAGRAPGRWLGVSGSEGANDAASCFGRLFGATAGAILGVALALFFLGLEI